MNDQDRPPPLTPMQIAKIQRSYIKEIIKEAKMLSEDGFSLWKNFEEFTDDEILKMMRNSYRFWDCLWNIEQDLKLRKHLEDSRLKA